MPPNDADRITKSADPDQSDLGVDYLLMQPSMFENLEKFWYTGLVFTDVVRSLTT